MSGRESGGPRCALAARARGDALFATAPPARRFVLLETPGAWAADLPEASGLAPEDFATLLKATNAVGARLLLVRRPGVHPAVPGRARRWATAEVGHGVSWALPGVELLGTDLRPRFEGPSRAAGPGRPTALICTQGRHDLCCAVEGRPVAAAAAEDPRVDVWECTHLGGDRFAANLLWLPDGFLLGGLGPLSIGEVLDAALAGLVVTEHYRGTCGDAPALQAAQWFLLRELGETDPARLEFEPPPALPRTPDTPFTVAARHGGTRLAVTLTWSFSAPQHMTCRATGQARVREFRRV